MTIYLTTFGTYGDVRPILAIAEALLEKGREVVLFANPFFQERIERSGVPMRAVGPPIDPEDIVKNPRLRHPYFGPLRIWREVFEPQLSLFFDAIMGEVARTSQPPELIVNHPWCFGGMLAAEKFDKPWAVAALAPLIWFSLEDPPLASAFEPPRWLHRWSVDKPLRWMLDAVFQPDLARFAQEHGLPNIKHRYFWSLQGASLNLGLWSPAVRGAVSDDPPGGVICGFPSAYPPSPAPTLAPETEAFLSAGDAPLVLGLGSALPSLFPEIYARVWRACEQLGWRAVLVGAPDGCVPVDHPALHVVPWAAYTALFPRARVVVHHGGIGSLAEACAAGRPQLVLPQGTDQYDNARRAELLGVGARCAPGRLRAGRIARLLRALDEGEEIARAASELASSILGAPAGAVVAADAIVKLIG